MGTLLATPSWPWTHVHGVWRSRYRFTRTPFGAQSWEMVQGRGEARPHGHPGPLRLGAVGSGSPRPHPVVVLWGETPAVGSPGREHSSGGSVSRQPAG